MVGVLVFRFAQCEYSMWSVAIIGSFGSLSGLIRTVLDKRLLPCIRRGFMCLIGRIGFAVISGL